MLRPFRRVERNPSLRQPRRDGLHLLDEIADKRRMQMPPDKRHRLHRLQQSGQQRVDGVDQPVLRRSVHGRHRNTDGQGGGDK